MESNIQKTIDYMESEGDMVLVPRSLLGSTAHALNTGAEAPKTLAAIRHYAFAQMDQGEVNRRMTAMVDTLSAGSATVADDFPDVRSLQEEGKYTASADWQLEGDGGIDLEAADFSDALMWLKEGKRVRRAGWNGKGQYVILIPGDHLARSAGYGFGEAIGEFSFGDVLCLKNAQDIMQPGWIPSMGDLLATDWQVVTD